MKTAQVMSRHPLFSLVVAKAFFEKYCPKVTNVKHKLRGKDGNGNPIDFSPEDKNAIKAGVAKMAKDLASMELLAPEQ